MPAFFLEIHLFSRVLVQAAASIVSLEVCCFLFHFILLISQVCVVDAISTCCERLA